MALSKNNNTFKGLPIQTFTALLVYSKLMCSKMSCDVKMIFIMLVSVK